MSSNAPSASRCASSLRPIPPDRKDDTLTTFHARSGSCAAQIVTRGIGCFTANCKARLHDHCFTNYRKSKHKCPTCNADWSTNEKKLLFVGEKAAGADDAKRKERRKKSVTGSDEEEGEGEPSQSFAADDSQEMEVEANATQDDPEPTQSQPNGRNGRSRAKAPKSVSSNPSSTFKSLCIRYLQCISSRRVNGGRRRRQFSASPSQEEQAENLKSRSIDVYLNTDVLQSESYTRTHTLYTARRSHLALL